MTDEFPEPLSEGARASNGETLRIDLNQPDWPQWKARLGLYPPLETQDQEPEDDGDDQPDEGQPEEDGPDPFDEDGDEDGGFEPNSDSEDEIPIGDQEGETPGYELTEDGPEFYLPIHIPAKIPLDPFDRRDFNSWLEFVNSANDDSLFAWTKTNKRASHARGDQYGSGWHGTDSWEDCISMALRTGWPEGRDLLYEALAIVRPRPEPFKSIEMSVAGAFPIVPNFCAGDPECMVMDPGSDLRMTKPIIRIDYNHWIQATTTPQDMILRGAAVLSLAETLERYGYSTELRIIGNSKERGWNGNKRTFRYSVVFKRAGEILDIDRAAFAIAHPSSMRRLALAILEQHPELEDTFHYGYGMPQFEPNDPDPNTIFIPGSTGQETPEKARKAVEQAASEILSEIQQIEAGD